MKWLAPQWAFALLFALVPIFIHFWKKSSAKKIVLGSLYLLHRKEPNFHKYLKLHQLLLLITRVLLLCFVVFYFLKTISLAPLAGLSEYFPFHEKTQVYLDTGWDSQKILKDIFLKQFPNIKSPNFEQLDWKDLNNKLLNKDQSHYYMSRFYGLDKSELNLLQKKGLTLVPVAKEKLKNTRLNPIEIQPKNPFVGEYVEISSSLDSNELNKAHSIKLEVENKVVQTRNLSSKTSSKLNFSFKLKAQGDSYLVGKVKIDKDEFNSDNSQDFKVPLRRRLKVALIEDITNVQEKGSKLHFIYQFLVSIQQNSPQFNVDFEVLTSDQFNNSSNDSFDWLVLGDLQNKVWKKKDERVIVFAQRGQIQDFYSEKFSLKTFSLSESSKRMEFLNLPALDSSLVSSDFKSYRHLQIKMSKGQAIVKSNSETLAMSYKGDYFFSFAFTKADFSGILHPYFPIYMYRLLLDRWEFQKTSELKDKFDFSRDSSFFKELKLQDSNHQRVDFSIPILLLILLLLALELYFVLSIEKQKS
ncbi:MAG: BatA domain-containing protein [Candidatus Cloacimonetes bacterium]|nr:BatA domain-containing protein [Candidatus Cloacimonadota bacterium]